MDRLVVGWIIGSIITGLLISCFELISSVAHEEAELVCYPLQAQQINGVLHCATFEGWKNAEYIEKPEQYQNVP